MTDIVNLLGQEADQLLAHVCRGIPKTNLQTPGPDFIDRVLLNSDRKPGVLRNLQALYNHGRLAGTGYLSLLPVDQGLSIQVVLRLHRIHCFSTLKILFDLRSKEGVMGWHRL